MNRMLNGVRNDIWELESTVGGSMNNNFGRIPKKGNNFVTIGEVKNISYILKMSINHLYCYHML